MHVDLNRLRIFYHVYRLDGVSLAAEKCNLSQPAVSQHLKKLEKELGVILFTRVHKKLIPTSAGRQLFTMVEPFIGELSTNLESLRYPLDLPHGMLRIGAPYEFGREYLLTICHDYRKLYPDVKFSVRLGEPIPTLDLLKKGALDFAVIDLVLARNYLGANADFYSIAPLIDEELVLICSDTYYDQYIQGDHSLSILQSLDYISDEHDSLYLQHWFAHHFGQQNLEIKVVMMVESHQASLHCVRLGMGLTVTSHHLVWQDIKAGKIVAINTTNQNAKNTISLIQLQDKKPTITEKSFHLYLTEQMQSEEMRRRFRTVI